MATSVNLIGAPVRYGTVDTLASGLAPVGYAQSVSRSVTTPINETVLDELGNAVTQIVSTTPDYSYSVTLVVKAGQTPPPPPAVGNIIEIDGRKGVVTEFTTDWTNNAAAQYTITIESKGTVDYDQVATLTTT
jgi:hypothetical protein